MKLSWIIFVFLNSFILVSLANAGLENTLQDKKVGTKENPHEVPRAASPVKIDGVLDDPAWENALILQVAYETWPGENIPPPVPTEVLITYSENYAYFGFRAFDPEPSKIRAHYSERDDIWLEDYVELNLDTFNDERRAFVFLSTALGVQEDFVMTRDHYGEGWDAIWYSAVEIHDWGYGVEIAIPFNQLRFQRTADQQIWGFNARRFYPRDKMYHIDVNAHDRNNDCNICQYIKIKGFEGVTPGYNIEIDPTLTTVRSDARSSLPDGHFENQNEDIEAGLSAKWGLTPNITFNGTINPDFSQVEADAMQLDINEPFALFYEEKRPFFNEGSDYFKTNLQTVYTRTMRDPSWGLKLTGKEGGNTIGLYSVRDNTTNLIFPGSQSSSETSLNMNNTSTVFRYKRDIGEKYTIGILGSDREGEDYYNRLLSLDGDLRLTNKDRVQFQIIGSRTRYPNEVAANFGQPNSDFDDMAIDFRYNHRTRSLSWHASLIDIGKDFRADLGFIPQVDYRRFELGMNHRWNPKPESWHSGITVGAKYVQNDDQDGNLIMRDGVATFSLNGPLFSSVQMEMGRSREVYNGIAFDQSHFFMNGRLMPVRDLEIIFSTHIGHRIDYANTRLGKRIRLNPEIEYKMGRHFRFNLNHKFEGLTVDGGRLYTANVSQVTAFFFFNVRTFLRAIFQYVDYDYNTKLYTFNINSKQKRLFSQILFSYKVNPRTVLFVGYSDNYLGNQDYRLTQSNRTFFTKLGYALVL